MGWILGWILRWILVYILSLENKCLDLINNEYLSDINDDIDTAVNIRKFF